MNRAYILVIPPLLACVFTSIAFVLIKSNSSDNNLSLKHYTQTTAEEKEAEEYETSKGASEDTPQLDLNQDPGTYTVFDPAKFSLASDKKRVVLFFYSESCEDCAKANKSFMSEPVPSNLVVLRTDYSASSSLRSKYGVGSQHTFVEVDKDGSRKKLWRGSLSYSDILKELDF